MVFLEGRTESQESSNGIQAECSTVTQDHDWAKACEGAPVVYSAIRSVKRI